MKKKFLGLLAMAGMLFATSCSEEEVISQSTGNEVKVTFTTELRNDVKSRAVGDDTDGIDQLKFAVYDEDGTHLSSLDQTVTTFENGDNGEKKATVTVVLVKGQTYSFVFWAQDKDYTAYSFDATTATVSINYDQTANNKLADAFFAHVNDYKVTGTFEMDVTLKRPFAQVNFLTTQYDLDKATAAGFTPSQSSVVVQNAATSLNVLDGTVTGNVEAKFTISNLISDETTNIKNAEGSYITWDATNVKFSSSTEAQYACNFKYLATAYFLPTMATSTSTITTSMSIKGNTDAPVELTAEKVNAQRNYRTNIYGNLLTSNGTFYLTVDPGFNDDHNTEVEEPTTTVVATIEQANALFAEGKTNVEIKQAPTEEATLTLPQTTDDVNIKFSFEENANPAKITISYADNATDKPENISIEGDGGNLVIDTPQSTATISGTWDSVEASTADNTLIVPKGVTITALTLNKGNAEIYYGTVTTLTKAKGYTGTVTWTVDSKEQLANIATAVNGGTTFASEIVELTGDIDLNNEAWTPIGQTDSFRGSFDGGNHTISNLKVDVTDDIKAGLFGNVIGNIKDIKLSNVNISGHSKAGAIVASIYGHVDNCHVDGGTIISTPDSQKDNANNVGGIVGYVAEKSLTNGYTVTNCTVKNLKITAYRSVGGIAGRLMEGATVSNCSVDNTVVIADMLTEYSDEKYLTTESAKAGEIVGDNRYSVDLSLNNYNNVTVKVYGISSEGVATVGTDAGLTYAVSKGGATTINLEDGEYDVTGCGGKTLTINGSENAILYLTNEGEDGCDYGFGSSGTGVGDYTFNGLTINTTKNTGNYKGYAYMKGTFNNCNFVGAYSLNNANDFTFNKCTFDFKNGYIWTWGAKSATFDGCVFNGNSKNILAHGWESTTITINNCEFAATEKGYASNGTVWTAAVEIDPAGTNTYTINFTGTNTKTENYAAWTRIKDGSTGHTITGIE